MAMSLRFRLVLLREDVADAFASRGYSRPLARVLLSGICLFYHHKDRELARVLRDVADTYDPRPFER